VGSDRDLIQIVDAAMAEAVRRSGDWIVCRPGCTDCCLGPFPITMLDAQRLREGLAALENSDPDRAARVRGRAAAYIARLESYPGDPVTGVLSKAGDDYAFDPLGEDVPCPALDPDSGSCDLYESRPITCRMFGPAVSRGSEAVGVCELCYQGASESQIAACQVEIDPALEAELASADPREAIVAFALLGSRAIPE